jgi:hypothetical protein
MMLSCLKKGLLLALLVVVGPAGLQDALAADWSIIPSVDLRVNIRLTRYDVTIFVNEAVGIELTCFL